MVDARPGFEGIWRMPGAIPTTVTQWVEDDGVHKGMLGGQLLPVLEVRTIEGRVFKLEE